MSDLSKIMVGFAACVAMSELTTNKRTSTFDPQTGIVQTTVIKDRNLPLSSICLAGFVSTGFVAIANNL